MYVGHGGIYRTTDGGYTWRTELTSPGGIKDVISLNGTDCVAVGGCAYLSTDKGDTWQIIYEPFRNVVAVGKVDSVTAVAVGWSGEIVRSSNGGRTWAAVSCPTSQHLMDVAFWGADRGLIVGWAGTILTSADGGASWIQQAEVSGAGFNTVCFLSRDVALAGTTDGRVFKTIDGGVNWDPTNAQVSGALNGISAWDEQTAVAVGPRNSSYTGRVAIRTIDGGQTWSEQTVAYIFKPDGFSYDVTFLRGGEGYLVGSYGDIYRSINGGQTWTPFSRHWSYGSLWPYSLWFTGSQTVVAAGWYNIWRSFDGGASWSTVLNVPSGVFYDVHFVGERGVAVGKAGLVYCSSDGGATWTPGASSISYDIKAVRIRPGGSGLAVGASGTILRTSDWGATWQSVYGDTAGSLYGLAYVDSATCIAVGSDGILRSVDGGATWAQIDVPNSQDLASVSFPAPNLGLAVGSNKAFRSRDRGLTWEFVSSQVGGKVHLRENGTGIAVSQLQVFITADAGSNWTQQIEDAYGLSAGGTYDGIYYLMMGPGLAMTAHLTIE